VTPPVLRLLVKTVIRLYSEGRWRNCRTVPCGSIQASERLSGRVRGCAVGCDSQRMGLVIPLELGDPVDPELVDVVRDLCDKLKDAVGSSGCIARDDRKWLCERGGCGLRVEGEPLGP